MNWPMTLDRRGQIVLNFACIYIVWGSTYLAIKYAIAAIPPFLMASSRFVIASLILFAISKIRKEVSLKKSDIQFAVVSGTMLVLANGMVCYAEKTISSGMAAVVVGTMPVWIMIFNWQFFQGQKPRLRQFIGILISLVGILFLTQSESQHSGRSSLFTWMVLLASVLIWTLGALFQRKMVNKVSIFKFSSIQLGSGGLIMLLLSPLLDGSSEFAINQISTSALLAVLYLILFGTVAAFTSFVWLNHHVDPTVVSTYALVNPVVAVWLGWLFANESVTMSTLLYSLVVLVGLYLVVIKPRVQQ